MSQLLETLCSELPTEIRAKALGDDYRNDSVQFLEDFLNEDADPDVLLASTIRPSQDTSNTSQSLIERIAELDSQQRILDDQVRQGAYDNLDRILAANAAYKQCMDRFSGEFNQDCEYLAESNRGADESWKELLARHTKQKEKNYKADEVAASSVLGNMDSIMDILELPALANACVRSGHYGECVEIASHVRRLSIRYSEMELIRSVDRAIQQEIREMINGLVRLLNTDMKQSHMIKIITYLKRIGPFQHQSAATLPKVFLKCRYQFIVSELEALEPLKQSNSIEKYIRRCVEVIREHCFQTVMTFESIFDIAGDRATDLLLSSFIKALVLRLCEIFRINVPLLKEESAKDGLFLQLIYCSQSLGRMGGDFSPIILERLGGILDREKWCLILKRQKEMIRTMGRR